MMGVVSVVKVWFSVDLIKFQVLVLFFGIRVFEVCCSGWGSNSVPSKFESDVLSTTPRHMHMYCSYKTETTFCSCVIFW